jgi:NADH-quinone oxidoreductase subunit F
VDLHLTEHRATDTEKAAVDSVLGAPDSGWEGGPRSANDGRSAFSSDIPRHSLLPLLHAIQARIGWISPGALNYVAVRMNLPPAEIHGVASFYAMFSLEPRARVVAHVCDDIACLARGAEKLCGELETELGAAKNGACDGHATWLRSPCLGLCERAPAALISSAGENPKELVIAPASVSTIRTAIQDAVNRRLPSEPDSFQPRVSAPQATAAGNRLLRRIGVADPTSLSDYVKQGGFGGLRRAIELGPEKVVREVIDSKLLGRGGAAFPTGKKWEALLMQRASGSKRPHYVVCNADESEPGTFKDRVLMEGDSFRILEGIAIAGLATGAEKGYIYIRGEYPLATERLAHAIQAARDHGYLGRNVAGSQFRFDIELRRGAGAYICGEETALFNSIEGYRGEPRNKPPFPTQAGLFRQPTVVNNVETLANIPDIVLEGGAAFARIGTEQSTGTRLFCLSGHVAQPGVYEVTFGTTLRQVIDLAGGPTGKLQAVLLGGAAGTFVSPSELDTPLTFEGTRKIGATLGSGVILLFDETIDLRRILLRIAEFFREETCGQCVPCRVGVTRQKEALERLIAVKPLTSRERELRLLTEIGQAMRDASICGLGQTASSALLSALNRWSLFS